MLSRRSFIQSTTTLALGALINPNHFFKNKVIGLQLYTVRDALDINLSLTLRRISRVGYNSLEGATYSGSQKFYGMDIKPFKEILDDAGLAIHSNHYRLGRENGGQMKGTILNGWDKAIDDAAELGLKYMVLGWLSETERGGEKEYMQLAEILNRAGEQTKKRNIQLCYHNHDFEFVKIGTTTPYDILLNNTDPGLVKMEIDFYWTHKAGVDPISLFKKHPGRFPLWHLKDMDRSQNFTEVGNGIINFKRLFRIKALAGMEYFFVEQDTFQGHTIETIEKSYHYVKKKLA